MSLRKIERIQERALCILFDDYATDSRVLLDRANKTTFLIKQHKNLAIEIFKTLKNLNPDYMKEIFIKNENPYRLRDNARHSNDLVVHSFKAFTYGECSLRVLGPNIWNALPIEFKNAKSLFTFKKLLNTWEGPNCRCKMCNSQ